MSTIECPICGREFSTDDIVIDDNGNPICSKFAKQIEEDQGSH